MKSNIINKLITIEEKCGIRIIHAIESGSRAYGINSDSSDYDVRFVYVSPQEFYNTIFQTQNLVLDSNTNNDISKLVSEDIDMVGYDVKKALYLLYKGSPELISWFNSDCIYASSDWSLDINILANKFFKSKASIAHYVSMAKGNYCEYIKSKGKEIKAKRYIAVLRPLICCIWIEFFRKLPPNNFFLMLNPLYTKISNNGFSEALTKLLYLIELKRNNQLSEFVDRIPILDNFCEKLIDYYYNISIDIEKHSIIPQEIDSLFHKIITTEGGKHGSYLFPC